MIVGSNIGEVHAATIMMVANVMTRPVRCAGDRRLRHLG
jgi:hypothetical protein